MRSISQLLDDFTQYVRSCSNHLPDSLDDAVTQLADHSSKYDALKESIQSSSKKGEDLLNDMKRGNPSSQLPPSAINNISAVERYLNVITGNFKVKVDTNNNRCIFDGKYFKYFK